MRSTSPTSRIMSCPVGFSAFQLLSFHLEFTITCYKKLRGDWLSWKVHRKIRMLIWLWEKLMLMQMICSGRSWCIKMRISLRASEPDSAVNEQHLAGTDIIIIVIIIYCTSHTSNTSTKRLYTTRVRHRMRRWTRAECHSAHHRS